MLFDFKEVTSYGTNSLASSLFESNDFSLSDSRFLNSVLSLSYFSFTVDFYDRKVAFFYIFLTNFISLIVSELSKLILDVTVCFLKRVYNLSIFLLSTKSSMVLCLRKYLLSNCVFSNLIKFSPDLLLSYIVMFSSSEIVSVCIELVVSEFSVSCIFFFKDYIDLSLIPC